jgi:hypothetical protein
VTQAPHWTDEQKRAICAVTATIPGYKPNTGTAFYVGGGYAITALHVVADTRPGEPVFAGAIRLNFKYANHETDAHVVQRFWEHGADWAVLGCENEPPVKPIPFGSLPKKDSTVEAWGYPEIAPNGFPLPAIVQDPGFRNADGPAIDLYSEKGKGVALYGLSGAPVMQDGRAVGIIRAVLETEVLDGQLKPRLVTDAGTVYACPSAAIIEWQEVHGRALLRETWAPAKVTTSNFIVYLSSVEPDPDGDGRLKGVVTAAGKHIEKLNLSAPHFERAQDAVASDEKLMQSAAALCRAKVVILDATDFEPAIMLLAGIRSVVRRGLTILSVGGAYALGGQISVPFNVSDANIVAHSDAQDEQTPNSVDLLVERIRRGVSETESPYYLDTPVFDALRRIPADRRGVIPSEEGVLVLCPFDPEYRKNNWKHLRLALNDQLKALRTAGGLPAGGAELGVSRSFELQSPRLVSQAIYEYIRRAKSCVVDLTGWSPNVLFELGVRLAASSSTTACLIEEDYEPWFEAKDHPERKLWRRQCEWLMERFISPGWRYNSKSLWTNEPAYGKAYGRDAESPGSGPASGAVQAVIEKALDVSAEPASRPVYRELMDSSDLFAKTPGRSKPVGLYPGNAELTECEEAAEFERLLAGWFYLFNRFTEQEIMENKEKRDVARELAVRLVNRKARFDGLPDRIKTLLEAAPRFIKRPERSR